MRFDYGNAAYTNFVRQRREFCRPHNKNEISILVNLADKCIQKWNENLPIKYTDGHRGYRQLVDYYRQYLPTYNRSGEKLVWINFIKKSEVKELPEKITMVTDSQFYYNCWVNLNQSKILD